MLYRCLDKQVGGMFVIGDGLHRFLYHAIICYAMQSAVICYGMSCPSVTLVYPGHIVLEFGFLKSKSAYDLRYRTANKHQSAPRGSSRSFMWNRGGINNTRHRAVSLRQHGFLVTKRSRFLYTETATVRVASCAFPSLVTGGLNDSRLMLTAVCQAWTAGRSAQKYPLHVVSACLLSFTQDA